MEIISPHQKRYYMNNKTYSSEEIIEMNKKHTNNIKVFVQPIVEGAKKAIASAPTVDGKMDITSVLLTLNALLDILPTLKKHLFPVAFNHKSPEAWALMLLSDAMIELAVPLVDIVIKLDDELRKADEQSL